MKSIFFTFIITAILSYSLFNYKLNQMEHNFNISLSNKIKSSDITVRTTLKAIHSSYLKSCVDNRVVFMWKMKTNFEYCRNKAQEHTIELESIINQDINEVSQL